MIGYWFVRRQVQIRTKVVMGKLCEFLAAAGTLVTIII